MRRRGAFASFWFSHEEQQRQHGKKHPAEKTKYVIVGKHGRLPLYNSPKRGVRTMLSRNRVHAFRHKCLRKTGEGLLGTSTGFIYVPPQVVQVCLHVPEL